MSETSNWFGLTLPRQNLEIIFNKLKNGNITSHCLNRNTNKIMSLSRSHTPEEFKVFVKLAAEIDAVHGIYGKNAKDTAEKIKRLLKQAKLTN